MNHVKQNGSRLQVGNAKRLAMRLSALLFVFGVIASSVAQETVVVGLAGDPATVDPHINATSTTVTIISHMFDTLVKRDADTMDIVGGLAESWRIPDNVTYEFTLHEGVQWHDGTPLTVDDVVFTFERMATPGWGGMGRYVNDFVESVEVIDARSVRITLFEPYAPFLRRLPTFAIVPKHYIEAVGNDEFGRNPMGSGPYEFVEWVKGDHITFVRNEAYWGELPEFEQVIFRSVPEPSTRTSGLLAGDLDVIEGVSFGDIPRLEAAPDIRVEAIADNRMYFYVMNSATPPFDNRSVRQAVNHAVDWETIVGLFDGYGSAVRVPALPSDFGYSVYGDELQALAYDYNPERARQLLEEAGLPDGFSTTLELGGSDHPQAVEVAQAIVQQLSEVGIQVQLRVVEAGLHTSNVQTGQIEGLGLSSLANPLFDPDHMVASHFDPNRRAEFFSSPELTALGDRGRTTTVEAERIESYREFYTLLLEEAPYLFGYSIAQTYALRSDIDWQPRPDNRVFMFDAGLVR